MWETDFGIGPYDLAEILHASFFQNSKNFFLLAFFPEKSICCFFGTFSILLLMISWIKMKLLRSGSYCTWMTTWHVQFFYVSRGVAPTHDNKIWHDKKSIKSAKKMKKDFSRKIYKNRSNFFSRKKIFRKNRKKYFSKKLFFEKIYKNSKNSEFFQKKNLHEMIHSRHRTQKY